METSNTAWANYQSLPAEQKAVIWKFLKEFKLVDSVNEENIEVVKSLWAQRDVIRTEVKALANTAEADWQAFMKLDVSQRLAIQKFAESKGLGKRISRDNISVIRAAWASRNA